MTKVLIHISINRWVKGVSINWWAERVLNYGLVEKVPTRIPLYRFPWMGWWKKNSWLEKFSLNSRENTVTTHVSNRISTLSMAHRHPLNEKVCLGFPKWRNLILIPGNILKISSIVFEKCIYSWSILIAVNLVRPFECQETQDTKFVTEVLCAR